MQRTLPLLALIGTVVACGVASVQPPPPKALLTGLLSHPAKVLGLVYPILPYSPSPGPAPSPRACVTEWNAKAPRPTMRWIAAHSARRADTTLATQGVQTIEKKPTRYLASTCAFAVAVGRTELVYVVAPPKGNGRWSGELLRYRSAATVARLTKWFNAAVSSDGSMHIG